MQIKETIYFDNPGRKHTEAVAAAVKKRCEELKIKHIVVASNSGETALKFCEALNGMDVQLVAVTSHTGFHGEDKKALDEEKRRELEQKGVQVIMCSHILSGVGRSITNRFGGVTSVELIAHTLRRFCEGVKVAVEISIMAADAGAIPTNTEIIAAGGTGRGADTAVVLKPAHMNNFFDLEIREIIAMPRQRRNVSWQKEHN
ncbi:MAG: pyruvate kinase alpha/beta domain-containing protein [Candidatus Poribacteria bacterium]